MRSHVYFHVTVRHKHKFRRDYFLKGSGRAALSSARFWRPVTCSSFLTWAARFSSAASAASIALRADCFESGLKNNFAAAAVPVPVFFLAPVSLHFVRSASLFAGEGRNTRAAALASRSVNFCSCTCNGSLDGGGRGNSVCLFSGSYFPT